VAQVEPFKPKLKPPETKRLKLNCDALLTTSAFKFNLRCYTWDGFIADVECIYHNAIKYNLPGTVFHTLAGRPSMQPLEGRLCP